MSWRLTDFEGFGDARAFCVQRRYHQLIIIKEKPGQNTAQSIFSFSSKGQTTVFIKTTALHKRTTLLQSFFFWSALALEAWRKVSANWLWFVNTKRLMISGEKKLITQRFLWANLFFDRIQSDHNNKAACSKALRKLAIGCIYIYKIGFIFEDFFLGYLGTLSEGRAMNWLSCSSI